MCPSYLATRDEKDSTRGRARVLQELTNGSLVSGWSSREVHESLDLCLSCKACSADCPAGVDMAQYKSEVLYRRYRRRPRPLSHYSLGRLPSWLGYLDRMPSGAASAAANALLRRGPARTLLLAAAGIDGRRRLPPLPRSTFRRRHQGRDGTNPPLTGSSSRVAVVLWVDTFSNALSPEVADAAVDLLEQAGFDVVLPDAAACCGLTWISTGQLHQARRRLRRLLDVLAPYASQGVPIVGLEPSCTATLRSDLLDLMPGDPRAATVAGAVRTLAELLSDASEPQSTWRPPDLSGCEIVVQPHCHQHSVTGYAADRRLLESTGASVTTLAGCCGLAGNWGMERGHYDVSVAIAETGLLPALREHPAAVAVADGFSCRTQVLDLTGRRAVHLAELLGGADRGPGKRFDTTLPGRPGFRR
jgi:Fe-S oxidoreductase